MTKVIFDTATSNKLGSFRERVEVCDEAGRVLGYFTPAEVKSVYDGPDCPLSEEELNRRQQETVRYTTDEVLRHLENL